MEGRRESFAGREEESMGTVELKKEDRLKGNRAPSEKLSAEQEIAWGSKREMPRAS